MTYWHVSSSPSDVRMTHEDDEEDDDDEDGTYSWREKFVEICFPECNS